MFLGADEIKCGECGKVNRKDAERCVFCGQYLSLPEGETSRDPEG
jgi:hypothetical protein